MFNLLSLALGLAAILFAIHSIRVHFCPACCILSFTCCCGALTSQLLEVRHLVDIGDWSALMDTMDAVIFAAAVLFALTVFLNLLALLIRKETSGQ